MPFPNFVCRDSTQSWLQGKAGGKMYADFEGDRDRGDFSVLPELHSVLSGMKVGGS